MKLYAFIFILIISHIIVKAQYTRILLDDDFSDWDDIDVSYTDAVGDQTTGFIDFRNLWITNDEDYLFVRFEVGGEINLQDENQITIYIDSDNNSSTGLQINGIGAELEYTFGERSGLVRIDASSKTVWHAEVGLVSSPTITSTEFELVFRRDPSFFGQPLFQSSVIKIAFRDNGPGEDELPDETGGVIHNLSNEPMGPFPLYSISQQMDDYLRVMTYNVLTDNLFDPSLLPRFTRLFQAAQPDIIGFEEIYDHSSQQTANQIESILPSASGETWYHSKVNPDIIAVSRYDIIQTFQIDGNGAFLINLRPKYESDLLFIVAHPPCCANNIGRQLELDAIMAFVREAKEPGGQLTLEENTPIMIVGDMNLVGYSEQLRTLLNGDIFNEGLYGPDFNPDWDGSPLADAKPYTTSIPMVFTWYDESSPFSPGRLDYIIYTDSVIEEKNSFVLFTKNLPPDTLNTYNLQANDSPLASDHQPVVADFDMSPVTAVVDPLSTFTPSEYKLEQNYPNPFNPSTTIRFTIPDNQNPLLGGLPAGQAGARGGFITLKVYDILGNEIARLVNEAKPAGNYEVIFDVGASRRLALTSGIYFYKIQAGNFVETKKMLLLK